MRSIRRQLTLGVLAALALLLGGAGTAMYWVLRDSIYDQFDDGLRVKALFIVTATQQRNNQLKVEFSDGFLREFDYDVAMDFFQVYNESGASITRSDSLWGRDLPLQAGTLEAPIYWDIELPNGKPGRAIGIEFAPDQKNRRGVRKETDMIARVVVASDRTYLVGLIAKLNVAFAISGVAMVGVIVLAVPLVLRRGLRPLSALAEQASRIDASTLKERFAVDELPSELKPIGGRLNDLLARLEASFERERRFSANLAHELRTPLAELRSQTELALKWPEERSVENDKAVLEITLQMEALVTRMLDLARAEQTVRSKKTETVELVALTVSVLEPLEPTIRERGLIVNNGLSAGMTLTSDIVLLRSIVTNLLENAAHYSRAGGDIRIEAEMTGKTFLFRVSNPADNLQTEDLPRLFERFWRKDSSRTGGGAHAGLGLALARSIAEQLGCELTATLDRGVLTMTLRGPR